MLLTVFDESGRLARPPRLMRSSFRDRGAQAAKARRAEGGRDAGSGSDPRHRPCLAEPNLDRHGEGPPPWRPGPKLPLAYVPRTSAIRPAAPRSSTRRPPELGRRDRGRRSRLQSGRGFTHSASAATRRGSFAGSSRVGDHPIQASAISLTARRSNFGVGRIDDDHAGEIVAAPELAAVLEREADLIGDGRARPSRVRSFDDGDAHDGRRSRRLRRARWLRAIGARDRASAGGLTSAEARVSGTVFKAAGRP